ncbi:MAG: DUF116 domain-containing protein [Methanomicrobiales archaeon]|nr:DUF116 domain-containing protein [Methanomicrobiales archaeon]
MAVELTFSSVMVLIGEITIVVLLSLLFFAFFLVAVTALSIRRGRLYFPRLLKSGFYMLEGVVRGLTRLFGISEKDLITFFIRLQNSMNTTTFEKVPVEKRAIFLPQCLRSSRCPADLTPEGLVCKQCGQCTTGEAIARLREMGYRVFIVPGSSFIQRMVQKYGPEAMIGVGCIIEVKDGLEMCDRQGIPAIGIVTQKDGCVETLVDWDEVCGVASLGLPEATPKPAPQPAPERSTKPAEG